MEARFDDQLRVNRATLIVDIQEREGREGEGDRNKNTTRERGKIEGKKRKKRGRQNTCEVHQKLPNDSEFENKNSADDEDRYPTR